jgi:hypothetical protein
MAERADWIDQVLGGVGDAALRLRSARRRMATRVTLEGLRVSQGLAEQRSRMADTARRGIEQLRSGAARPLGKAAGAIVERLPVARRGDFLRLEGRVATLAREIEALERAGSRRLD